MWGMRMQVVISSWLDNQISYNNMINRVFQVLKRSHKVLFLISKPWFRMYSYTFNSLAHTDVIVILHYSDVITTTMASQFTNLTVVYSIVDSGVDQRKHQSSASQAFVRGIHRWAVNSPHRGPVTRKMFDDVIMNNVIFKFILGINVLSTSCEMALKEMPKNTFDDKSSGNKPLPEPMSVTQIHADAIKWKHFPRYWPFVRGIHWSPVNSPHKGQLRGALMFPLICARINVWANSREAGDLRRHRAYYDVTVMICHHMVPLGNNELLFGSMCYHFPHVLNKVYNNTNGWYV